MTSWSDMTHDLRDVDREATGWDEMTRRHRVRMWLQWYWWPTRRWVQKLDVWWYRHVRRLPEPPPFEQDRVALHFGFVEGAPPCTDGPICAEHGWELSPLITAPSERAPSDAEPPAQPRPLRPKAQS